MKYLQIRVDEDKHAEIKAAAAIARMTLDQWVKQAIDAALAGSRRSRYGREKQ